MAISTAHDQPFRLGHKAALLGLVGSTLLVATCGALFVRLIFDAQDKSAWVNHTYEVRAQLDAVMAGITDAARGQRGYLLTGNRDYLKPYDAAADTMPADTDKLAEMVGDNAPQAARAGKLAEQIGAKLQELGDAMRKAEAGDRAAAVEATDSRRSIELMTDIQSTVQTMKDEEAGLLIQRRRSAARVSRALFFWAVGLILLGFASLAGAVRLVVRETRKQAEADRILRDGESRLRAANQQLLMAEEIAHVGHWRIELPGNAVTWSDEVYRIHGLDPSSYSSDLGTAIDLFHPEDRAEVRRCVQEAMTNRQPYAFKLRIVRPDGEVRHVLSRGMCEVDQETGELRAVCGAIMDVTELAQAERHLTEKSALLQATLDNIEQALIKVAPDGTIELANRRFGELLDLSPELLDRPRLNLEDVLAYLASTGKYGSVDSPLVNRIRSPGTLLALGTYEHRRPNGTVLEVRTVPAAGGAVVSTYADITARRQAEAAMRESEARYRVLAETTSDVVTRLDLDFERQYVSPACRRVLGYEPEEMLGVRALDSIHPDDVVEVRALAARLAAGQVDGDRAVTTYRAMHKLGHWVWVEEGLNLARDLASGAPTSLICSLRDVTERQRAARHLERAKAAAEQATLAKADFVANMSHELRTPLTGIVGVHDLLGRDPKLTDAQRRLVGLASDSGRLLLNIVNDILDYSKIEAGQLAIESIPFDLQSLVENCRELAREGLKGKPVRIETSFVPNEPGWFLGDPHRLQQILLNLLANAVKFTEQGEIGINVAYRPEVASLRVDITDTGIGIPTEKLPMLFERFSQADASTTRRYGGTGLGLAISKRLVELMDGRIGVETQVGQGSRFWLELPIERLFESSEAAHSASLGEGQVTRYILLAEDNRINQEIISAMLTNRDHVVTVVSDGAAAVQAAKEGPVFDVILMDLQMPGMDGLTATCAIRHFEQVEGLPRTPIIGLTANAMAEDVERCLKADMDGHVAKPVDWANLFAVIDRVVSGPRERPALGLSDAEQTDGVLNRATLETLERIIGQERLAKMLAAFAVEVDRRLAGLGGLTATALSAQTHSLKSSAGQLGFSELSKLCADIENEARRGGGLERIAELRATAERALSAARSSRFGQAA